MSSDTLFCELGSLMQLMGQLACALRLFVQWLHAGAVLCCGHIVKQLEPQLSMLRPCVYC